MSPAIAGFFVLETIILPDNSQHHPFSHNNQGRSFQRLGLRWFENVYQQEWESMDRQ
jgi:hypothetical protein